MRTFTLLPLAIALIGASAYAAPQTEQQAPESALGEIQVRAAVPVYKLTPAQIDEVKGSYVMDNGSAFKITQGTPPAVCAAGPAARHRDGGGR